MEFIALKYLRRTIFDHMKKYKKKKLNEKKINWLTDFYAFLRFCKNEKKSPKKKYSKLSTD